MTGIILAGGKNSRMGINKSFIKIAGVPIIDYTINTFKRLFKEIIIVSNSPEDFEITDVKIVSDIIKESGPLGGIYTGLVKAQYERCFITACDMPFLVEPLIQYMLDEIRYEIVVPIVKGYYEPLFASYSKKMYQPD